MKQVILFIAGFIACSLIALGAVLAIFEENQNIRFFDTPKECICDYKIEVFQALEPGYALGFVLKDSLGMDISPSTVVLIYSPNGEQFYDNQVIVIPQGFCAKKTGIYKYKTHNETYKTVPVVQVLKKDTP